MFNKDSKPIQILRSIYLDRKARNPRYSVRAFARDMGMSQSLLSLIWGGKRNLTVRQAAQISALLGFNKEQAESFIDCALGALPPSAKAMSKLRNVNSLSELPEKSRAEFVDIEIDRFKAICHWYHLALLDLSTTEDFNSTPEKIAEKLGISLIEAKDGMERLISLGLMVNKSGVFKKKSENIYIPTQKSNAAIRKFHQQMISKAVDQLSLTSQRDFEAREISAMTMAIPKSMVSIARKKIQEFQKNLAAELSVGRLEEVYQLNIQFFPLTQTTTKTGEIDIEDAQVADSSIKEAT